ncbi:IS110 family transposase [Streptomyces capitiformicae]|uniref:Transposase IS110-like N-terminal domain-containing protein n=1 Tax=Streptomyces capitiformicae TaxID=2014920 RepID=A0A918ZUE3_9ACTN|nr:transposase [Streptomyces capitiformicae]GHE70556.1 hypothetical protein GCM10017771_94470 [Streptomyces capitiformicae]
MTANAGFDIAKGFHWLAVTDDRGRQLLSHRIDNTPDAIGESIGELHAVEAEHGPVTVGLGSYGFRPACRRSLTLPRIPGVLKHSGNAHTL